MEVKLITNQKGGKTALLEGYLYRKNKVVGQKSFWKCVVGCKAFITIVNGQLEGQPRGQHSHAPDGVEIGKREFMANLKETAMSNPSTSCRNIYNRSRSEFLNNPQLALASESVASLKPLHNVKSTIVRSRQKSIPSQPLAREDINITGIWSRTLTGQKFLWADSGEEEKIIIFGTESMMRRLFSSERVFLDGTFKCVPRLFEQLYTLHCFIHGQMFPAAYILLPGKNLSIYSRMFCLLKDIANNFQLNFEPRIFHLDFEAAAISSIQDIFPNSRIIGCLFHFCQAIWRKVQNLGLTRSYRQNSDFNKLVRRLCALPLAREMHIEDLWLNHIHAEAPAIPHVNELLDYYVRTWLDEDHAMFPRAIWNQFDNLGPRTTNHLEGWHHCFNKDVGKSHPNLYEFILSLQKHQDILDQDLILLQNGAAPKPMKKKYKELEQRLTALRQNIETDELTPLQFLDSASNFLHMNA